MCLFENDCRNGEYIGQECALGITLDLQSTRLGNLQEVVKKKQSMKPTILPSWGYNPQDNTFCSSICIICSTYFQVICQVCILNSG